MAIFTQGFASAKFINPPQNSLVEIIYVKDGKNYSHLLDVDWSHPDFQALMDIVSIEDVERATYGLEDKPSPLPSKDPAPEAFSFRSNLQETVAQLQAMLEEDKLLKAENERQRNPASTPTASIVFDKPVETVSDWKGEEFQPEIEPAPESPRRTAIEDVSRAIDTLKKYRHDKRVIFPLKVQLFENPEIRNSALKKELEASDDLLEVVSILQYLK